MQRRFHLSKRKAASFITAVLLLLSACRFYFPTTKDRLSVPPQTTSVERGKNLTFLICSGCHYDPKAKRFIGRSLSDLPKIGGHLYSANLTQSQAYGRPPHYSDAELFYLLKTGISQSGKFMPYMMRPMMADEDIYDVIAYLRSSDPAVQAYDTTVGRTRINAIGKAGIRHLMGPQPYRKGVVRPNENDAVGYGRYLVGIIGCYHCHSSKASGLNFLDPAKSRGYLQGGLKLHGPGGRKLRSPNLTPDKETGIGDWTQDDFSKAVRDGIAPGGRKLSPPMDHFTALSDQQVQAIYAYLKTLPLCTTRWRCGKGRVMRYSLQSILMLDGRHDWESKHDDLFRRAAEGYPLRIKGRSWRRLRRRLKQAASDATWWAENIFDDPLCNPSL